MKQEIINLLSSCKGIDINFGQNLSLRSMKDGRWRVLNQVHALVALEKGEKHIFDELEPAVDKFVEISEKRKLSEIPPFDITLLP